MNDKDICCKDVMCHICDNLGEDENSERCIAIKAHIAECPNCQKYFDSICKTISFYKQYNAPIPMDVHKKLLSLLGLDE